MTTATATYSAEVVVVERKEFPGKWLSAAPKGTEIERIEPVLQTGIETNDGRKFQVYEGQIRLYPAGGAGTMFYVCQNAAAFEQTFERTEAGTWRYRASLCLLKMEADFVIVDDVTGEELWHGTKGDYLVKCPSGAYGIHSAQLLDPFWELR